MCVLIVVLQGEEGPPSLEYIQAKDLFPQKELVKEDDSLQVSCSPPPSHCMIHQNENSWLKLKFRTYWAEKPKPENLRRSICAGRGFFFLAFGL